MIEEIKRLKFLAGIKTLNENEENIDRLISIPILSVSSKEIESQIRPDLQTISSDEPEIDVDKVLDVAQDVVKDIEQSEEEKDYFVDTVTKLDEIEKNFSYLNEDQINAILVQLKKVYKTAKSKLN